MVILLLIYVQDLYSINCDGDLIDSDILDIITITYPHGIVE